MSSYKVQAGMHNSPPMIGKGMKNGHGIITMITVTNMPKCTTHQL